MNILNLDLQDIFHFTMSPFELLLRGTIMYWFLFLIFRFILRRDIGSAGVSDFLFVVILGDASQNAMIGNATSTSDGMMLIATLVFWNYSLDYLSYRFAWFERFTSARRICIYKDGKLIRRNMRREFLTRDDIDSKIHEEGLRDISEVDKIYMESDGEISILKLKKD